MDAMAFGHISQFYFTPLNKELYNFIDTDTRNLADYLRNIRDTFWPDWHEAITSKSLQTKPRFGAHEIGND